VSQAPRAPGAGESAARLADLVRWTEELLGFRPGEIDPSRPLAWQGFDSVMAVDLHKRIERETGVHIPLDRVLPGPKLAELVEEITSRLPSAPPTRAAPAVPQVVAAPASASPIAAVPAASGGREAQVSAIAQMVEVLLGFRPGEIDVDRPLAWQGFDSVMAVDLKAKLAAHYGVDLPLDRVLSGPRVTEIADALLALAPHLAAAPAPASTSATGVSAPQAAEAPADPTPSLLPSVEGESVALPSDAVPLPPGLWVVALLLVASLFAGAMWLTRSEPASDDASAPSTQAPEPGDEGNRRGKRRP
jgi:acyl carrier protein